jgi:hypothetical protein
VVVESTLTNVVSGTIQNVSTGLINILSATYEDGDYPLTSIVASPLSLRFLDTATSLVIRYTTLPATYTNISNELSSHPIFHDSILQYLIYMYYDKEGEGDAEESGLAERYYQKWLRSRSIALSVLNNSVIPSDQMDPVETVDNLPKSSRRLKVEDYFE